MPVEDYEQTRELTGNAQRANLSEIPSGIYQELLQLVQRRQGDLSVDLSESEVFARFMKQLLWVP